LALRAPIADVNNTLTTTYAFAPKYHRIITQMSAIPDFIADPTDDGTLRPNIKPEFTKLCPKSYGTALVKVRWNFSDEALWISDAPTNL
jgi:hypothetical protein